MRMEGGLKSRELEESVPRRDLLGVSGLMRDWSPPEPNITLWREAGVLHLLAKAFLAPCIYNTVKVSLRLDVINPNFKMTLKHH